MGEVGLDGVSLRNNRYLSLRNGGQKCMILGHKL